MIYKILKFYSNKCEPCKQLDPIINNFLKQYKQILYQPVNVDNNPALTSKYSVRSIPTIVVLKEGKVTGYHVGTISPKGLEKLVLEK